MSMKEIIRRGCYGSPSVGVSGAFYPWQFIPTRMGWLEAIAKVMDQCKADQLSAPEEFAGYTPYSDSEGGFVYLYEVNDYGDLDSQFFTHEVISGGITFASPEYGYFAAGRSDAESAVDIGRGAEFFRNLEDEEIINPNSPSRFYFSTVELGGRYKGADLLDDEECTRFYKAGAMLYARQHPFEAKASKEEKNEKSRSCQAHL